MQFDECTIVAKRIELINIKNFYNLQIQKKLMHKMSSKFYIIFTLSYKCTRRELLREILYKNIAIIARQHSKIYFVDTFGDFSHTVERNLLKSAWQIFLYILA